jgi:site-specific recombinase XerD
MKVPTLAVRAAYLLKIIKYLRLDKGKNKLISLDEVNAAAMRWANRRPRPALTTNKQFARRRFVRFAKAWLLFIDRLQIPACAPHACVEHLDAFTEYQKEKGLSPVTIESRGRVVQMFLDQLCCGTTKLNQLTPQHVDDVIKQKACEGTLKRVSLRTYIAYLRAFFRYAESRRWCYQGMADAIMAPPVYAEETIPAGPTWEDVQRLLATTESDRPADIRDRALLLLLIVYGFRSGEVRKLRLDDLDWERELIHLRRSKQGRTHCYPLSRIVGDAILRYLKEVRPRTRRREVFLALNAPLRPLEGGTLGQVVGSRLRPLGISLAHYGPHVLRHACATHLLAEGFKMNEISNYLGHLAPQSTHVYAKVNLRALRTVANFSLEGLT